MFAGSPFSNNPRPSIPNSSAPTTNNRSTRTTTTITPFDPATTHPASILPRNSNSASSSSRSYPTPNPNPNPFHQPQRRVHVTSSSTVAGQCENERAWVGEWKTMALKDTWHPAALGREKVGVVVGGKEREVLGGIKGGAGAVGAAVRVGKMGGQRSKL